jgi:radical SAM superfamily enzyme YgiQ (UPF0313 family)
VKRTAVKIHLVFAPPLSKPKYDEWYEGHLPPLGILYLASYVRRSLDGLTLRATDGLLRGTQATYDEIVAFEPDILGVSVYTAVAMGGYELINRVKRVLPKVRVVVGGPHATALPEDVLGRSAADVVAIGEGEITFTELVRLHLERGDWHQDDLAAIDGIAYRLGGVVVRTRPRAYIADLDTIPLPARDLLPLSDYRGYYFRQRTPEYPMIFTRGCPFQCNFCAEEVWKQTKPVGMFRWRSARNVVDEMEELHTNYGINEIQDVSDEFNGHLGNSLAICEEKMRRNLDIPWKTLLRVHPMPEKLVKALAESGCWQVSIGIESGNPETVKGIGKRFTMEQLYACLHLLQRYRIKTQGLFMLFNVWEEAGTLRYESVQMSQNTIFFAESLVRQGLLQYTGNFNVATPYPGSELYRIALRHNLIKPAMADQWDSWLVEEPIVMRLPGISEREQIRLMKAGSLSITRCLWREGQLGLRDLPGLIRRGLKVLRSELAYRRHPVPETC